MKLCWRRFLAVPSPRRKNENRFSRIVKYMEMDPHSIQRDTVLAMYRQEQELRLSDFVQNLYDKYRTTGVPWPTPEHTITVEDVIQMKILVDAGYTATQENLTAYRSLRGLWQHDEEIAEAILYIKNDITHPAEITEGQDFVDASLQTLSGSITSLGALVAEAGERPLVIVSGSLT